jgi:hypothetical protein
MTLLSAHIQFLVCTLLLSCARMLHAGKVCVLRMVACRLVCAQGFPKDYVYTSPPTQSLLPGKTSANMIDFKDTQLALIHIPLHLYSSFLQPILQLLLPNASRNCYKSNGHGAVQPPKGWPYEHPFVNISITPIECSIVCSRGLANEVFVPVLSLLDAQSRSQVHITSDDFVVMQVDGEGLDAGQRVLELTSPLAMAGM